MLRRLGCPSVRRAACDGYARRSVRAAAAASAGRERNDRHHSRRMGVARRPHGAARADRDAPRRHIPSAPSSAACSRLHRHLVPGVRPAQGHAREQVRDPGLGRAEGDRSPQGQVRRAQRRHPAGRLQLARGQAGRHPSGARRSRRRSRRPARSSTRPTSAARSPTTTSGSRRPIRASATPRCSSPRTGSS